MSPWGEVSSKNNVHTVKICSSILLSGCITVCTYDTLFMLLLLLIPVLLVIIFIYVLASNLKYVHKNTDYQACHCVWQYLCPLKLTVNFITCGWTAHEKMATYSLLTVRFWQVWQPLKFPCCIYIVHLLLVWIHVWWWVIWSAVLLCFYKNTWTVRVLSFPNTLWSPGTPKQA